MTKSPHHKRWDPDETKFKVDISQGTISDKRATARLVTSRPQAELEKVEHEALCMDPGAVVKIVSATRLLMKAAEDLQAERGPDGGVDSRAMDNFEAKVQAVEDMEFCK